MLLAINCSNYPAAYFTAAEDLRDNGLRAEPRGTVTRELQPYAWSVDPALLVTKRGDLGCFSNSARHLNAHSPGAFLLIPGRGLNYAFGIIEAFEGVSGAHSLERLAFYNPRIKKFADNGELRGAYGPRLRGWVGRSDDPGITDQLGECARKLKVDPDTRQAVACIWDPVLDNEPDYRDYPCNDLLLFKLRGGALNCTVTRRSSDLIWGAPYDHLCFRLIQWALAEEIGAQPGALVELSDSLHWYESGFGEPYARALRHTLGVKLADVPLDHTGTVTTGLSQLTRWLREDFWPAEEAWRGDWRSAYVDGQRRIGFSTPDLWLGGAAASVLAFHLARALPDADAHRRLVELITAAAAPWKLVIKQTLAPVLAKLLGAEQITNAQCSELGRAMEANRGL